MEPWQEGSVDRKLRETFEPDMETVRRVVGRAVSGKTHRNFRFVTALAGVAVCLLAGLLYLRTHRDRNELFTLDCVGDVAVVRAADGTSWIVSTGRNGQGPEETGLILLEGDLP